MPVGCGLLLRRSGGRGSGRGIEAPRSSNLPKIILPAVVCRPEVTEMSLVLPLIFREFVDVEDFDAVQLGDLVEVEVVGYNLGFVHLGELDQLHVNFANGREIVFDDLNLKRRDLLDALEDVDAAAPPVTLQRVGRVGDELQLA